MVCVLSVYGITAACTSGVGRLEDRALSHTRARAGECVCVCVYV